MAGPVPKQSILNALEERGIEEGGVEYTRHVTALDVRGKEVHPRTAKETFASTRRERWFGS